MASSSTCFKLSAYSFQAHNSGTESLLPSAIFRCDHFSFFVFAIPQRSALWFVIPQRSGGIRFSLAPTHHPKNY